MNIISTFEHELGRLLSPVEVEILEEWKSKGFSESLIKDALKEAIYNGASANSYKYIGKILQNWKNVEETANILASYTENTKVEETPKNPVEEEPDLSWLEEEN